MLSIKLRSQYHGANPLASDPVLVGELRCSDGDWSRYVRVIERMKALTAEWYRPPDDDQPAATDAERIGRFIATWSLQAMTVVRGALVAAGARTEEGTGVVLLWLGYHDSSIARQVLTLALQWLTEEAQGRARAAEFEAKLTRIWATCRREHPDYQARIVMEAARRRDLPVAPGWGLSRHWRFGSGARSRVLYETSSSAESHFGSRISASKRASKVVMRSLGLPTPEFRLVDQAGDIESAAQAVGFPCVTKPLDRGGGKGVSAGLCDVEAVRNGFEAARAVSPAPVLVEAHLPGEDYRLMVIEGRFIAAIRREPPSVTGDGRSTIAELLERYNRGLDARFLALNGYRRPVALDLSARTHLAGLGMSAETVLDDGQSVRVRSNANLSTGGVCVEVTEQVHPEIQMMAESLAQTLGLDVMGADYLTPDISQPVGAVPGGFIEFNVTPGLDLLIVSGWSPEDAGDLALSPEIGRIPTDLLAVPEAALDGVIADMRAHDWPSGSGWATADRAGLSGVALVITQAPGWPAVRTLMNHRSLQRALIVADHRQIAARGLPLDRFDRALIAGDPGSEWMKVINRHSSATQSVEDGVPIAKVLRSLLV